MTLFTILVLVALVLALLGAFNVPSRVGWLPLAFATYMLAILLTGVHVA